MIQHGARRASVGSLRLRFMLYVVLGAMLFAAAAGVVSYRLGHSRALDGSLQTLDGLARAVGKTAAIGAYAADRILLREIADGLTRNELVASAEITSAKGLSLGHSQRADVVVAPEGPLIELSLTSPFDASETVGVLHIRGDAGRISATADREAYTLALLMIAQAVLIALTLYFAAARLFSSPLQHLAHRLRDLPPGCTEHLPVPARHHADEIGMLIQGANALIDTNAQALARARGAAGCGSPSRAAHGRVAHGQGTG